MLNRVLLGLVLAAALVLHGDLQANPIDDNCPRFKAVPVEHLARYAVRLSEIERATTLQLFPKGNVNHEALGDLALPSLSGTGEATH